MKISLNWIKEYVNVMLKPDELADRLTMAGLEVEAVHKINNDTIFEIEVTPNRADCLNMVGMAREIAAILNKPLKLPKPKRLSLIKNRCDISVEDKKACPRYIGTVIEGVQIKNSSSSILNKLASLSSRSINNVVDVTNVCLMDKGQPLHAFDYDKLEGKKIIVRFAKKGEKIITLDGVERILDSSMLVIADEKKPIAIAGVMGGKNTEVTTSTKNILLESANFNPILIRRTSKKLALSTDSSYRFERGINLSSAEEGSNQALDLILKIAGGKITARTDFGSKEKKSASSIVVGLDEINGYLGTSVSLKECRNILKKLGFTVSVKGNKISAKSPAFRRDINQPVDIIEEVARIVGYDNIPMSLPTVKVTNIPLNTRYSFKKEVAVHLLAQGYSEAVTFAMYDQNKLKKSQLDLSFVKIRNPLSNDQELMRPSLLPSLLSCVVTNVNYGQKTLRLFELGKIYAKTGERDTLAMISCGERHQDWREDQKQKINFYDIKGALTHVLGRMDLDELKFSAGAGDFSCFETGESAVIQYREETVGHIGRVNEKVGQNWSVEKYHIYYVQIDLEKLYAVKRQKKHFYPLAEYPGIVRDISLAVKQDMGFEQVRRMVLEQGGKLLKEITFDEEYLGDKIQTGYRGIIFSLLYQSSERTLREDEINEVNERVVQALIKDLGVIRR